MSHKYDADSALQKHRLYFSHIVTDKCNRNTTSGRIPMGNQTALKIIPTWSKPTKTSAITTGINQTEYADWENNMVSFCNVYNCNNYCRSKNYSHWVCVDTNMCHCYGHDPVLNDSNDRGWRDLPVDTPSQEAVQTRRRAKKERGWRYEPQRHCEKEYCSTQCRNVGFKHSICIEDGTCHCYESRPVLKRRNLRYIKPVSIDFSDWVDQAFYHCTRRSCRRYCEIDGFTHGLCLLADRDRCHCYGHIKYDSHGQGWKDVPLAGCVTKICLSHCHNGGFAQGICSEYDACHCYKGKRHMYNIEPSLTAQENGSQDWENMKTLLCYEAQCTYRCERKQYIDGICVDDRWCHCYGHSTDEKKGYGWENNPMLDCMSEDGCLPHCNNHGFVHGICIDDETCHCYENRSPPKPPPILKPIPQSPQYSDWEDVSTYCTTERCVEYCEELLYTHSICEDEMHLCHCYGRIPNSTFGPGWKDDSLLDCTNEYCVSHCNENGFFEGICIDGDGCHCYKDGSRPKPTIQPSTDPQTFEQPSILVSTEFPRPPSTKKSTSRKPKTSTSTKPKKSTSTKPKKSASRRPTTTTLTIYPQTPSTEPPTSSKTPKLVSTKSLSASRSVKPTKSLPTDRNRPLLTTFENKPLDWENITATECYDGNCIDECQMKHYVDGICMDEKWCHCYGHRINGMDGAGWESFPMTNCVSKGECSSYCDNHGFVHGICTDDETCHCYEQESLSIKSSSKSTKPIQTAASNFSKPTEQTRLQSESFETRTEPTVWKGLIKPPLWDDFPVEKCVTDKCGFFCRRMGHTDRICTDLHTCHCFSCDARIPQSGCEDKHLANCKHDSCSNTCKNSGYIHAICVDRNNCHCYEKKVVANLRNLNSYATVHLHGWEDKRVQSCKNMKCKHFCHEKGYTREVCLLNDRICHCYGENEHAENGPGWKDYTYPHCKKQSCMNHCKNYRSIYSVCKNSETCHCYRIVSQGTSQSLEASKLPETSQTLPHYPYWKNLTDSCKWKKDCHLKCATEGFKHWLCLKPEYICHCYVHVVNDTHSPGWEDDPLYDCEPKICLEHCNRHQYVRGICIDDETCHCFQEGTPPKPPITL